MQRRLTVCCAGAAVLCGMAAMAARAQVGDKGADLQDQDRSRVERELSDLEGQRTKLDARIRELRRHLGGQSGRIYTTPASPDGNGFLFVAPGPNGRVQIDREGRDLKELTPEQRKSIEAALETARRALESVRKELPPEYVLPAIPDLQGLQNRSPRVYARPDGNAYRFGMPMGPELRAEIQKSMERMRADLQNESRAWRQVTPGPGVYRVEPAPRASNETSPEIRAELKRLRDEMQQLRDEVKRLQEKPDNKF